MPELVNAGSTPVAIIPPVQEDSVAINVYQNSTNSHQYILAVKGTKNIYDVIADGSFITGGKANSQLKIYANLLASKVSKILTDDPSASITLTGHSMGGAIAQVVGAVGNFPVVSFDAPGVGDVLQSMRSSVRTSLGEYVAPGTTATVENYRLYGDQVSFAGDPLSNSITKTVANIAGNSVIDDRLLPKGWLANHSMPTLLSQLEKALGSSCIPAQCVSIESGAAGAEGPGRNITDDAIFPIIKAAPALCIILNRGYCALAALSNVYVQNVLAGIANFVDPGPGWIYSLEIDASSPHLGSISLPLFGDVFGWALHYEDQNGWSSEIVLMSEDPFIFTGDIEALTFAPLDALGNRIYNFESFFYDLTFAQDGRFFAVQTEFGILREVFAVPEPSALLLVTTAGFLLVCMRGRRRGCK